MPLGQKERFLSEYEFDGHTTPEEYVQFLDAVLDKLPSNTKLCLILGATKYYNDAISVELHSNLNNAIVEYAKTHPRVKYIKVDDCVKSVNDFTNQINHFKRIVYFRLSQKLIECLNDGNNQIESVSKSFVLFDTIAWKISRSMKEGSAIKTFLRKAYRKIKGKE